MPWTKHYGMGCEGRLDRVKAYFGATYLHAPDVDYKRFGVRDHILTVNSTIGSSGDLDIRSFHG